MTGQSAPAFSATIYAAGDINAAKQACRSYCLKVGLCVHVYQVDYIYTGGEESGFAIGIINYARFPQTAEMILHHARTLAELVRERTYQHSYSIVTPDSSYWSTLRETP